jgi:hypothetical protein
MPNIQIRDQDFKILTKVCIAKVNVNAKRGHRAHMTTRDYTRGMADLMAESITIDVIDMVKEWEKNGKKSPMLRLNKERKIMRRKRFLPFPNY